MGARSLMESMPIIQNGHAHPTLQIVKLTPQETDHWRLFPLAMERVKEFLARFHLESPPETVTQYFKTYWAAGGDNVAVWVVLQDGAMVGHCVAAMESSWGVPYAMVMQLELNHGITATKAERQAMMASIEEWTRSQKATTIKMLAIAPPEVWHRHAGFTLDKYLMVRQIPGGV